MASSTGSRPNVVIVGAGIAGLTAALYLLEAGFDVKVLERDGDVGGKFGASEKNKAVHEHAYHFLSDWCVNLWSVLAKIGLSRGQDCVPSKGVQFLRPRAAGGSLEERLAKLSLEKLGTRFTENLYGGVVSPDAMMIWFYSLLELMAYGRDLDEQEFMNRISVNGFMRSLPYMTDEAALLHQEALLKAFSIPSYETSARSYRRFARFFSREPSGWILNQPVNHGFWPRFKRALDTHHHDWFQPATTVTTISVEAVDAKTSRVSEIGTQENNGEPKWWRHGKDFLYLLVTVPVGDLVRILEASRRLREQAPGLLELKKLRSKQMASLDVYLTKPLPGVPAEHVTLIDDAFLRRARSRRAPGRLGREDDRRAWLASHGNRMASRYALSFVDNYQIWHPGPKTKETWLNVVAADFEELADLSKEDAQRAMLDELQHYLEFDPSDVDQERTDLRLNKELPLLVNSVGSWQYRPPAGAYTDHHTDVGIENFYLAGDYCRSAVDVVSLEGAVMTARIAARQIAEDHRRRYGAWIRRVPQEEVPAEVSERTLDRLKDDLEPWLRLAATGAFASGTRVQHRGRRRG